MLNTRLLSLPTDRLTLGDLRRIDRRAFTAEGIDKCWLSDVSVFATLHNELSLAEKAYANAAGNPDPFPSDDPRELAEALKQEYVQFGICGGMAEAEELIRGFTRAAAQQGRPTKGR